MVASTRCLLSNSTRNIVPGSTVVTLPSTSICSSFMTQTTGDQSTDKKTRGPVSTGPRDEIRFRLIAAAAATATTTATASAAVFTTSAAAAGRAFFTWLGNVDCEGPAVQLLAIEGV